MEEDVVVGGNAGLSRVLERILHSTIGLKAVMALTGLALVGFAFVHMAGHLQMFQGPAAYNHYAHMLQSLGGIKWAIRLGLLAACVLHAVAAFKLSMRNAKARPVAYAKQKWLVASIGARLMRPSGAIILFFILYHLLHFTALLVGTAGFVDVPFEQDGVAMVNVYQHMIVSFQNPLITVGYAVSVALLGVHLSHGIQSSLQTLGALNSTYRPFVKQLGPLLSGLLVAGFVAVPVAILARVIH